VPEAEISASVPALDAVHDLVRPLWHDAFPQKDYDAIKELIPQLEERLGAVEAVELPGILREKEDQWVERREKLMERFTALKAAAEDDDQDSMLGQTEAFHLAYESLVRVIRPVVPELDAFHQEMYKLYHYYMPAYDVEKIRETAVAMQEKLGALEAVQLPERLSDKQDDFHASVAELANQVQALARSLESPDRDGVNAAIESVHAAYQDTEKIFD
jgi:uncharacterized coiled-coil DUF342 family protein